MSRVGVETERLRGAERVMRTIEGWGADGKTRFRAAAEEAPFMIRTLGLGSGMAALAAKERERLRLAGTLAQWLLHGCPHSPYRDASAQPGTPPAWESRLRDEIRNRGPEKLEEIVAQAWVKRALEAIAVADRDKYRVVQIEALGYAGWIKRLAQAFCPKGDR